MILRRGLVFMLVLNVLCAGRSVTHKKDKDQAQFDKEVLLEDEDYEEDEVMNLTSEEQKERLQKLVEKKIDANHDGFVDMDELRVWSLKAFDTFESDDAHEEFRMVDSNKDGHVSWSEFVADMFGEEFSEAAADKKNLQLFKKDEKLYAAADMNQDGQLDLPEFILFRIPRRHPDTKRIVYEDTLGNYDLDKNGSISLDEFLHETQHDPDDKSFIESEIDRFKDELDEDGDGLLTGDEIFRWIDPDNKEDADDEADHLMVECDADKDGKLSASEIINNHSLWVESDVTDYGKQLLMNHNEL